MAVTVEISEVMFRVNKPSGISMSEYEETISAVLDVTALSLNPPERWGERVKLRGFGREEIMIRRASYGSPLELWVEILNSPVSANAVFGTAVVSSAVAVKKIIEAVAKVRNTWNDGTLKRWEIREKKQAVREREAAQRGEDPGSLLAAPDPSRRSIETPEVVELDAQPRRNSIWVEETRTFEDQCDWLEIVADKEGEPLSQVLRDLARSARRDWRAGRLTNQVRVVRSLHRLTEEGVQVDEQQGTRELPE